MRESKNHETKQIYHAQIEDAVTQTNAQSLIWLQAAPVNRISPGWLTE